MSPGSQNVIPTERGKQYFKKNKLLAREVLQNASRLQYLTSGKLTFAENVLPMPGGSDISELKKSANSGITSYLQTSRVLISRHRFQLEPNGHEPKQI